MTLHSPRDGGYVESKPVYVSMELLAQITAGKYMSRTSLGKDVCTRMEQAANNCASVNINKYLAAQGTDVVQGTLALAYARYRQMKESMEDFPFGELLSV